MIVAMITAVGVLSALWSPTRIKRLAALELHHIWLVWVAFATQVVVFQWVAAYMPETAVKGIHLGTYAILVAFIVLNRHVPGALLIALGTACNLTAIVANGGSMPASKSALDLAGANIPDPVFQNSKFLADPNLLFLGDIFAIPDGLPLSNVFSIGDVLIVVGGTYLAHRWCSRADVLPAADDAERDADELLPAGA